MLLYSSFKWLHFVALISWMAGILYLYRLLIYLAENGGDAAVHTQLSLMARKLYRIITRPAMLATLVGGVGMLSLNPALLSTGWLHVKLACVVGIGAMTLYAGRLVGLFAQKAPNLPSSKRLRLYNEIPTLLMMIVVGMAVFRPF